jgi:hypothetical protein
MAIVVSGALASKPHNGGEAWVRLSYVLGLRALGCDVHFVEQVASESCTDDALAYFDAVAAEFAMGSAWLIQDDGAVVRGGDADELRALASEAELLLNVSGNLTWDPAFGAFRRRAYVDVDPGYTQCWLADGHSVGRAREHHVHFSVGLGLADGRARLPDAGLDWRATVPPVVLEEWPATPAPAPDRLTTVASWRGGYGRLEYDGVLYGQKAHAFRALADLPARVPVTLEVALAIDDSDAADRTLIEAGGWHVVDPRSVAATPDAFRRYVQGAAGEFSPAQQIYTDTVSGWASDRTARFLASGRPAIVGSTGLDGHLPLGDGLLTFTTAQEAVSAIEEVQAGYAAHCDAARSLAESHFASDRVLGRLLDEALA